MADVRLDASVLAGVASRVRGALDALAWDVHRVGSDVLGDAEVADAAEAAFGQQKARASVLETSTDVAAQYPGVVADRFAAADAGLARSVL